MKTKHKSGTLTKSALSVALVLIMLVCAFPLTAFAADWTSAYYYALSPMTEDGRTSTEREASQNCFR